MHDTMDQLLDLTCGGGLYRALRRWWGDTPVLGREALQGGRHA